VDPEVPAYLIDAETTARDEADARNRMRLAIFLVTKALAQFGVTAYSIPAATFYCLASLKWIRASGERTTVSLPGRLRTHCYIMITNGNLHRMSPTEHEERLPPEKPTE
jgi:hypothetical protein